MLDRKVNRRQFLSTATGAVAFPYVVSSSSLGLAGTTAPSNRIAMGCIGLGIQGTGNMREFLRQKDVQVTAVCDVRGTQLRKGSEIVNTHYRNTDCKTFTDFRDITGATDIDTVLIATPDHWHPLIGIDAARNGKHMYYEKPIGWSFKAGQVLCSTVKRYGVTFQFGTQQRSSRDFRFACELVRNGKIGKLHTILVGVPGGVTVPNPPTEPVPKGFDYDMWLGPAPLAPHSFERTRPYVTRPGASWTQQYSNWYHISDYCIGFIGNWGIHHIDIAQWGANTENTGPVQIQGSGIFPKEGLADCVLTWQVENKFAKGLKIIHMDNSSAAKHPEQIPGFSQGVLFKGTDGWVFVNRSKIDAHPKSLLKSNIGPNDINLIKSASHHRNFIDSVKTKTPTACPVDIAVKSNTICQIDNIAIQLKRKLTWDPKKEIFENDPEANRMLSKPMRTPWKIGG